MRTQTIAGAECNKSPKQLASNPLQMKQYDENEKKQVEMPQDLLSLKVERKTKILAKIDSLSRIVKKTSMWNSIPAWTAR